MCLPHYDSWKLACPEDPPYYDDMCEFIEKMEELLAKQGYSKLRYMLGDRYDDFVQEFGCRENAATDSENIEAAFDWLGLEWGEKSIN